MFFYYLVRRIYPSNSEYPPTFQLVYCNVDYKLVEENLALISANEKLSSLSSVSYSIQLHPDTISGKELERRHMTKELQRMKTEMAAKRFNTWSDPDDLISETLSLSSA